MVIKALSAEGFVRGKKRINGGDGVRVLGFIASGDARRNYA